MVVARGSRPGDPPIAALPVGVGERSRPAGVRAQNSRQGDCAGARCGASVCLFTGACHVRDGRTAMNPKTVSYEQLVGISACLALALAAHLGSLPVWVLVTVAASGGIRVARARRGRAAPPRGVRLAIAALAVALLFLQFRTFNGLAAGTALLALMAGLKLLETDTQRDIYIITLIIYFVSMSALLEGESFWLLAYLIGVCWVTTATLLRLTTTLPVPDWRRCLRYSGRMLSQAVPLALVFWLLFPRFAAPLWHLPEDRHNAASGLSDTM